MTAGSEHLADSAEDLYENAPCGYLSTRLDGTIVRVNRTFESLTGYAREELTGQRRFAELLAPGDQIYHETHYAPLLQMQGSASEIAFEIVRADGTPLSTLVNSTLQLDAAGRPDLVRTTVLDATDRRRYERELLAARRREQELAHQLQRGMLPGELPTAPGIDLAAVYEPGVSGLEVGGDWYDAFWVEEDRRLELVIGDVVGRGIEAAATMSQLRSATRALASTGLGPASILDGLDQYVRRHGVGNTATVACMELDLPSGSVRYACAGHPPPAVLAPGAEPHFLWEGRSGPLDALPDDAGPRPEARCPLDPQSLVLLYTDGLVERRGRSLRERFDRLLAELGSRTQIDAAAVADAILRRMDDETAGDDVCLLVTRLL